MTIIKKQIVVRILFIALLLTGFTFIYGGKSRAATYKEVRFKSYSQVINHWAKKSDDKTYIAYAKQKIKTKFGKKTALFIYYQHIGFDNTMIYITKGNKVYLYKKYDGRFGSISKNGKYMINTYTACHGVYKYNKKKGVYSWINYPDSLGDPSGNYATLAEYYKCTKTIGYKSAKVKLPRNCTIDGWKKASDPESGLIIKVKKNKVYLGGTAYQNRKGFKIKGKWYKHTSRCKILVPDDSSDDVVHVAFSFKKYFSDKSNFEKDGVTVMYIGATIKIKKGKISSIAFGC